MTMSPIVRRVGGLVVLALLMIPVPQALAGNPPPSAVLVEDPANDVAVGQEGGAGGPMSYAQADLRSLAILEFPGDFVLQLTPAQMPEAVPVPTGPAGTFANPYPRFTIEFNANGIGHTLWIQVEMTGGGTPVAGADFRRGTRLDSGLGGPGTTTLEEPAVLMDARTGSYQIRISKASMAFEDLRMSRATVLSDWFVRGFLVNPVGGAFWIGDSMGPASAPFAFSFGLEPSIVTVSSPTPFHISNGVASAYTYEVHLQSTDGKAHTVQLQVLNGPLGWEFLVPTADIEVPPEGNATAVMVAVVPFAHYHGMIEEFRLQATEQEHVVGGMLFGIVYTDIPQPSGHHDTLVVHSRAGGSIGYVNTLEDDPFDEGIPIPETSRGDLPVWPDCFVWTLALEPALAMGLDMDLGRTGTIRLTFESDLGVFGNGLNGTLIVQPLHGAPVTIADFRGDMDTWQQPQTTFTLNATVVPRLEGDFVDAGPGSMLALSFTIGGTNPFCAVESTPPKLHPGGMIQLPLRDFHVPVGEALEASSGWRITAPEAVRVAPGQLAVLVVEATNLGSSERTVDAQFLGGLAQKAWVPQTFHVPSGGTRPLAVSFMAPDLPNGETIEVLVAFESDGVVAGFEHVQVTMDEQAAAPPQIHADSKGTPAPSLVASAFLLVALACARRRLAPPS
jgi:hypothetical protein